MARAKFVVNNIKDEDQGNVTISLNAVYSGSEENKTYWQYTPSGSIVLSTVNKAASDQFKIGKEYYIDFTLAEK